MLNEERCRRQGEKQLAMEEKKRAIDEALNSIQTLALSLCNNPNPNLTLISSGIDGGVENRPVVNNVLRPNPEA